MDSARQATKVRSRKGRPGPSFPSTRAFMWLLTQMYTGCLTCRAKKVKCDEQRSACGRCRRLALACEWDLANPSRSKTKAKRKAKPGLTKILPNVHGINIEPQNSSCESDASLRRPRNSLGVPLQGSMPREEAVDIHLFSAANGPASTAEWDNWYQELGFAADFPDLGNFVAQGGLEEDIPVESLLM